MAVKLTIEDCVCSSVCCSVCCIVSCSMCCSEDYTEDSIYGFMAIELTIENLFIRQFGHKVSRLMTLWP